MIGGRADVVQDPGSDVAILTHPLRPPMTMRDGGGDWEGWVLVA